METLNSLFSISLGAILLLLCFFSVCLTVLSGLISYSYLVDRHISKKEKAIYVAVTGAFGVWCLVVVWYSYHFAMNFLT